MADNFENELSRSENLLKERLIRAGKIARDITNNAFKELLSTIDDYSNSLDNITDKLVNQLQNYDKLKQSTAQFGDALKSTLPFVKENKDLASKLTQVYSTNNKLIDKLVQNQEELIIGQLETKDIAKDIAKIRQNQLNIELSQRDVASEIEILQRESVGLQGEEKEILDFKLEALREINEQLEAEKENTQAIADNLNEQAKSAAEIENKVGLGGKLLDGFKKIPILGDILDVSGAKEAMQSAAAGGASSFGTLGSGIKALGPSLKAALGPLLLITVAVEAIQMLIGAMFEADEQVTNIAKGFNITKEDARDTRKSFFEISNEASNFGKVQKGNLVLQKDLISANLQLNELLGTSVDLSSSLGNEGKELAFQFANASKFLKLGTDEQKGLLGLTASTGKNVDNIKNSILGTTRLRKVESNILLDERKILKDVLTASNATKLSVKGGAEGLTKAAFAAAELGSNLSKVEAISKSFLNFEESISAELEAELLTGKNLNLETARRAALNGDIETVAKEINKQIGTSADFTKMNVIQQEALAKAMGTSREELADMLVQQESLNSLKGTFNALSKETLATLKTSGKIDEATYKNLVSGKAAATDYFNALQKSGMAQEEIVKLLGEEAAASLESQTAQEKFNDSLELAKQTFQKFVDGGSLDKLADFISGLVNRGALATVTGAGAEEESGKSRLEKAGYTVKEGSGLFGTEAFKTTKIFDKVGKEIDSAFGSEGVAGLASKYAPQAEDFISRPGQPIQKFRKDDIIVGGTSLSKGENNGEIVSLLKELITAVTSGGNVYLDGTKVGTAMNVSTYRIQ
jgi:hypothetical protein